jgi:hypothetical protein
MHLEVERNAKRSSQTLSKSPFLGQISLAPVEEVAQRSLWKSRIGKITPAKQARPGRSDRKGPNHSFLLERPLMPVMFTKLLPKLKTLSKLPMNGKLQLKVKLSRQVLRAWLRIAMVTLPKLRIEEHLGKARWAVEESRLNWLWQRLAIELRT